MTGTKFHLGEYRTLRVYLVAEDFEFEPFFLRGGQFRLSGGECGGRCIKGWRGRGVQRWIMQLLIGRLIFDLSVRDCFRQGVECVLLVEAEPALARLRLARTGRLRLLRRRRFNSRARLGPRRAAPACRYNRRHIPASGRYPRARSRR